MTDNKYFETTTDSEVFDFETMFKTLTWTFRYDPYQASLPPGFAQFLALLTKGSDLAELPFTTESEEGLIYNRHPKDSVREISIGLFLKLLYGNLASQAAHLGHYVWAHLDDRGSPMCVFWATAKGYYARRIEEGSTLCAVVGYLAASVIDTKRHD